MHTWQKKESTMIEEGEIEMDTLKKIVADKQNMPVKFDDGQMKVDLFTASLLHKFMIKSMMLTRKKLTIC